jgi:hypothetical protein
VSASDTTVPLAGHDAAVEVRFVVRFLLDDFVCTFRGGMTGLAGGHGEIHSHGAIDQKDAALFLQRNFHGRIFRRRAGQQIGMPVGQFAPPFLSTESLVLLSGLRRLPCLGILQLVEGRATGERGRRRAKQAVMEGLPHRLGSPDTVVKIPVIME